MIEQIDVKGFRCLKTITLDGLKRVNVIVGANASGKTALLEAIFLASVDSVEKALQFRVRRGLGEQLQVGLSKASYDDLWKDLFFSHDEKGVIRISLRGSRSNTRSVTVAYSSEPLSLPLGQVPVDATAIIPIEFVWMGADGVSHTRRPELTEKGITFGSSVPTFGHLVAFFSPGLKAPAKESADWFSELSKRNEETVLIDAIHEEFPYIDGLSLETYSGQSMIYAKVRGLREKLPLGMVSDGASRVTHILLGIVSRPHGIVLVDEIENGLFYDRLSRIWVMLLKFCQSHDVQLFASTHSRECIKALGEVVADRPEEACLIRATREDGECTLRRFEGKDLVSAAGLGFEVR